MSERASGASGPTKWKTPPCWPVVAFCSGPVAPKLFHSLRTRAATLPGLGGVLLFEPITQNVWFTASGPKRPDGPQQKNTLDAGGWGQQKKILGTSDTGPKQKNTHTHPALAVAHHNKKKDIRGSPTGRNKEEALWTPGVDSTKDSSEQ